MRSILFVTGTRADFGKMKSLIRQVEDSDFEYSLFVTGMHTLARHGYTADEVYKSFGNAHTFINHGDTMEQTLANTINGLSGYVRELKPDLLVVHGDRVEALAGAIVGALRGILVAHIEGGEISGNIDELMRHATTKMSHIHFVANEEAANRLKQLGEENIFVIGSPDIDLMLGDLPPIEKVKERYEIPFDKYGVVLLHPPVDIVTFARGLRDSGHNYVVIYPNNDGGYEDIISAYEGLGDKFRILPSMRFEYFLSLLKESLFIIGNSSSGVREAPIYGVPSINIGGRQKNRFNYKSIKNIDGSEESIIRAIASIKVRYEPSYHFGRGNSAELFIEALKDEGLWQIPRQKQFIDL